MAVLNVCIACITYMMRQARYYWGSNLVSTDDLEPVCDVGVVVALAHTYLSLGSMYKLGEGQQLLSYLAFSRYCCVQFIRRWTDTAALVVALGALARVSEDLCQTISRPMLIFRILHI